MMMENLEDGRLSFGYEDTDRKIEISLYGLVFEISNLENVEELENIDRNDVNVVEAQLEKILGSGAVERINDKRIRDGYKKLDLSIELSILGCIFEAYAKSVTGNFTGRVLNTIKDVNEDMKELGNREERRDYNRGRYSRGRRGYRRY